MANRHDSEYCGGMLILAFDTTAAACSLVLWRDGDVLHSARVVMDYGQAEALMPMIEQAMAAAGLSYAELDRIAVTIGPGSFTGVRVGLAAARGIAMAADKPVVGVTTMDVLAHAVPESELRNSAGVIVAIDTKRGDFFAQKFTVGRAAIGEIVTLTPDELRTWSGSDSWIVVGTEADALPDAVVLARLAAERAPQAGGPMPLYVHAPSVTMPV